MSDVLAIIVLAFAPGPLGFVAGLLGGGMDEAIEGFVALVLAWRAAVIVVGGAAWALQTLGAA